MRIVIAAVGKMRAAPETVLADDYLTRARGLGPKLGIAKLDLAVVETSRKSSLDARMSEEANALQSRIPQGAHVIALDEAGRSLTSEDFARQIAKLRDSGVGDLVFLIGGPDGLAPATRENAQSRLALGAQTWPHMLVRAMLAEQLYRALAILARHPYHRARAR